MTNLYNRRSFDTDLTRYINRPALAVANYDFGLAQSVHISAGIAIKVLEDTTISLYKRADDALYSAKENGRNCYVIGDQ